MVPLAKPMRSLEGSAGFSTRCSTLPGWLLRVTPIALFQLITYADRLKLSEERSL